MTAAVVLYLAPGEWCAAWNGTVQAAGKSAADSPEELWHFALAGLSEHFPNGAHINVVVSSEACHFLALPWSSELMDTVTAMSYTRNAFAATFGNIAAAWQLAIADGAFAKPRLACGTAGAWFGPIPEPGAAWRIVSARPSVERVVAKFRRHLKADDGALAFPDGSGTGLLRWVAGDIVEARHLNGADPYASLECWQARSELELGRPSALYWIAPGTEPVPPAWTRITDTRLPANADSAGKRIAFWSL